ncbi:prepilin peptidase [Gluconobacter sp. Dm-74]|nr:A24 family peptidase [Gluconobacter sp. Dm-74]MBS1091759.1 prepilin peptidase [Gluconobacter sp. Dm-74]
MTVSLLVAVFLLAPVAGSFLGVLIRRIPRGETVVSGRSHCESCHVPLSARDLIPILSYVAQKGRCRHCKSRIAPEHLWIELAALTVPAMALLARVIAGHFQDLPFQLADWDALPFVGDCILGWGLLALSVIDLTCLRLPDMLTLPLLLMGLVEGYATAGTDGVLDRALGSAAGWLIFALIAAGYRMIRHRQGLGGGDVKLLAMGGAWVGLGALPVVIGAGSALGIVLALATAMRSGRFNMTILVPFGPCLAAAIWLARLMLCRS